MSAEMLRGLAGPGFEMAHGSACGDGIDRSARLSEDGVYRYSLSRHWAPTGEVLAFVMLNPSTADGRADDPTIRRCMGFARREFYAGIVVVNLFAYRATDPSELAPLPAQRAVGPDNDAYLSMLLTERVRRGLPTVAAWGAQKGIERRVAAVRALVPDVDWRCLGTTKTGDPRHPLYVRGNQPLESFGCAALDSPVLADALGYFWVNAPARRAEIEALCRDHGLMMTVDR